LPAFREAVDSFDVPDVGDVNALCIMVVVENLEEFTTPGGSEETSC
jgi:hypothetical protein